MPIAIKFTVASTAAPLSLTTAKAKLVVETAVKFANVFCPVVTGSVDMVTNGVVEKALVKLTVPRPALAPSVYVKPLPDVADVDVFTEPPISRCLLILETDPIALRTLVPEALMVTFPVLMVPAEKLPELSRFTIVLAVFALVAASSMVLSAADINPAVDVVAALWVDPPV